MNHVGDWGTQFGMLITHLREVSPEAIEDGAEDKVRSRRVGWVTAGDRRLQGACLALRVWDVHIDIHIFLVRLCLIEI